MKHLTASLAFCTALLCAVAAHAVRLAPWTFGGDVGFHVSADASGRSLLRISQAGCDSFTCDGTKIVIHFIVNPQTGERTDFKFK